MRKALTVMAAVAVLGAGMVFGQGIKTGKIVFGDDTEMTTAAAGGESLWTTNEINEILTGDPNYVVRIGVPNDGHLELSGSPSAVGLYYVNDAMERQAGFEFEDGEPVKSFGDMLIGIRTDEHLLLSGAPDDQGVYLRNGANEVQTGIRFSSSYINLIGEVAIGDPTASPGSALYLGRWKLVPDEATTNLLVQAYFGDEWVTVSEHLFPTGD